MSPKVPCLFCFSNTKQGEGHRYQGDKSRRDRVYRFLRDLLGIRISPVEDFDNLSENAFLPLCVPCSLIFRNLSGLQDQLLHVQEQINLVVQEIRTKIQHSDGDLTSSLAVAIQSIDDVESFVKPATTLTSSTLAWMQKFRQQVGQEEGIASSTTQNVLFVTGIQQLFDEQGQGIVNMMNVGYTVPDGSTTFYLAQEPMPVTAALHHEEVSMEYQDADQGDEAYDNNPNEDFDTDDSDSDDNYRKSRSGKGKTAPKSKTARKNRSSIIRKKRVTGHSPSKRKISPKKNINKSPAKPKLSDKEMSRKFKCKHCPWTFNKMYQLKCHFETHTGEQIKQQFHCKQCNEDFPNRKAIQRHNAKHHGDIKPFKCSQCSIARSTSDALQTHMKIHDETIKGPPWVCTICPDSPQFLHRLNLKRHLSNHLGKKKFTCPLCPSVCSRKEDMLRHMTKKHKDGNENVVEGQTFNCNLCTNKFPSVAELMAHLWSHGSAFRLKCRLCNTTFTTLDELTEHNELVHGVVAERFPCLNCGLALVTANLLKQHMKIHEPETVKEQKVCDICQKAFCDVNSLNRHVKAYHSEFGKPFPCESCEMRFIRKHDRAKHFRRVHGPDGGTKKGKKSSVHKNESGENTSATDGKTCDICEKSFCDATSLKRHNRSFHEDFGKPFPCESCEMRFMRKDDCAKHTRRMHGPDSMNKKVRTARKSAKQNEEGEDGSATDNKTCDICDKTFWNSTGLSRHNKAFHEDFGKPFACESCEQRFNRKDDRAKHFRRMHGPNSVNKKVRTVRKRPAKQKEEGEEGPVTDNKTCDICDKTFSNATGLSRHNKSFHEDFGKPFECESCDQRFTRKDDCAKHFRRMHGPDSANKRVRRKPVKHNEEGEDGHATDNKTCDICDKTFSNATGLSRHNKSFHEDFGKPFECESCDQRFTRKDDCAKHFRRMHGPDSANKRVRRKPVKQNQDGEEEPVTDNKTCDICEKTFSNSNGLIRHNKAFHEDFGKPFECENCDQRFTRKDDCAKHFRRMHGPDSANKRVRRKPVKQNQDGEEEPVTDNKTCDICEKTFSNSNGLIRHNKAFHEDFGKPFACESCEQRFNRKDDCAKHFRRMHGADSKIIDAEWEMKREPDDQTEESESGSDFEIFPINRDTTCDICEKSFSRRESLTRHIKMFHGNFGKPFPCGQCEMRFNTTDDRVKHTRRMHGNVKVKNIQKEPRKDHEETETSDTDESWDSDVSEPPSKKRTLGEKTVNTPSFDCDVCDKSFETAESLRSHERVDHFSVLPALRITRSLANAQKPESFSAKPSANGVTKVKVIVTTLDASGIETESTDAPIGTSTTITKTILAEVDIGHTNENMELEKDKAEEEVEEILPDL